MLIMIDGIDGSGKSTIIQAYKDYLASQGNAIFDLRHYWQEKNDYPALAEIKPYDFIFACEPTYAPMGKIIREELINNKNNSLYSARAIAEAYSLDRLILYNKMIIPLLQNKKTIILDRGVSSSLAYQPLHNKKLTAGFVKRLPGNKLALVHRPDHLIIMQTQPATALLRLTERTNKKDEAIFEKLKFQERLAKRYASREFQNIFKQRRTIIHYLSGEEKIDIMKAEAIKLFKKILNNMGFPLKFTPCYDTGRE